MDGAQPTSVNIRNDCTSETAMAFAFLSQVASGTWYIGAKTTSLHCLDQPVRPLAAKISKNALDYLWIKGGYAQVRPHYFIG